MSFPVSLFDFTERTDAPSAWRSVDDPVMGGVSESQFMATDNGAAFTGTVSLKRGGGFCSVRAPKGAYEIGGAEGLQLRLRGDGKQYWVTLYTESGGRVSYRAPIRPPEHWADVNVPFDALVPYRRGTEVPDAPPFDPSQVRTIGFLIADKQDGPFQLSVMRIRAVG